MAIDYGSHAVTSSSVIGGVGSIVQVQNTLYTPRTSQTITANTATAITGINVSITPRSVSNKILIFARWSGEPNASAWDAVFLS